MEEKDNITEGRTYTQKEVESIVGQVNQQAKAQCENIMRRCQFLEEQLMYKRLDYLFKVVDSKRDTFDSEFIQKCIDEIQVALTIPDNTEVDSKTEEQED